MRFLARLPIIAVTGSLILAVSTAAAPAETSAAAAGDAQSAIVEDYAYPGADKILAERKITLRKGDGRILLVNCADGGNLVEVYSARIKGGPACFRIAGPKGYLTMEIPETYYLKGGDNTVHATLTAKGRQDVVTVNKNDWTPVGESVKPEDGPAALLEIRATS